MKRTVPMIIAGATGFVLIISHFIPFTESWGGAALAWFDIIAAFAFVLGGGNLVRMQLKKISDRRPGWGYAAVTLVSFLITLVVGLFKVGVVPSPQHPGNAWAAPYNQEGAALWWVYEYFFKPLQATVFALLAFYISSAAFRAFRGKNAESIALLATAFIVLLGRTYAGIWLTGDVDRFAESLSSDAPEWLRQLILGARLDRLTDVVMNVFNLAGMRAIKIGVALGVAATSLKVLLGVDRSYLGSADE